MDKQESKVLSKIKIILPTQAEEIYSHLSIVRVILLLLLISFPAFAESPHYEKVKTLSLKEEFSTISDWYVTVWQAEGGVSDDDDPRMGDLPAKICFWNSQNDTKQQCTEITSSSETDEKFYKYQTIKELSVIKPIANKHTKLLKFVTEFSAGTPNGLDQLSFWQYDKDYDDFRQTGEITISEQGEYKLFDKGKLAGLLITASARWQVGVEAIFSPHKFYVNIYQYNDSINGYINILGYLTPKKYPSFDDVDKIDVISNEIGRIIKLCAFLSICEQSRLF